LLLIGTGIAWAEQDEAGDANPALSEGPVAEPGPEIVADRTATSQTFRLPDGQLETRIFESPINYRDADGQWMPIGAGLREAPGAGLTNGANDFDLSLPGQIDTDPVRLSVDGEWVASQLAGPNVEAVQLDDKIASYEATNGGFSLDFTGLANGIKEDIEIGSLSAPSTFSFDLSASEGLAPVLTEDGAIVFRDESARPVAILPTPVMSDSTSPDPAVSHAIRYELEPLGAEHWTVKVIADRDWLSSPQRTWPIRLDPSITVPNPSLDCAFGLYGTSTNLNACGSKGSPRLRGHYQPATAQQVQERERSVLKFDTSSIPSNTYIANATVGLFAPWEPLNVSGIELRRVTGTWTSSVNWIYKDASGNFPKWTSPGGDFTAEGAEILASERKELEGWWNFSNGLAPLVEGWVSGKVLNQGLLIKLKNEELCQPPSCTDSWVSFNSSAAAESGTHPYLAVTYYPKAPASSKVVSPIEGTVSAGRLKLKAKWAEPGVQGISFEYKTADKRYEKIPTSLVRNAKGEEVSWPMAVSGFESEPLYFDAGHASGELTEKGGEVLVRANFTGPPGIEGFSEAAKAKLDLDKGGPKDAVAPVGPGSVDLLTGNFTVSHTDVSIPGITAGLEFTRTHSSRSPGEPGDMGVLGRGWKPSAPVEVAGGSEWRSVREVAATVEEKEEGLEDYALLTDLAGYEYAFEKINGAYVSPPEATGYVLAHLAGSSTFTFSDPQGNVTTFENRSGGSDYLPVSVLLSGSTGTARMIYDFVNNARRLSMIIAPAPPGRICNQENVTKTTAYGCKALTFQYKSAAIWGASANYGERLASITYYGPAQKFGNSSWEVAKYAYDTSARLIAEWDPRVGAACLSEEKGCLKETYAYVGADKLKLQGGEIATITSPGKEPWTLEYGALASEASEAGRLKTVKRASLVASSSVAQTTIAYQVPVSGSGAPYDLGGAAAAAWGQQDVPSDATAIFPPDEVPASPPKGYAHASIYYMDPEGQQVNVATPSGGGTSAPSITTAETDEYGNVVRELSAQNRLRALSAASEAEKIAKSHELETKREYLAEGTELRQEWGPMHEVRLSSGSTVKAQLHTTIQYEDAKEGWNGTGPNPHLPTRVTTGAKVPKQGEDSDQRTSETKYNWTLRKPTETIVDPAGLNLHTVVVYDGNTGLPIERRLPANPAGGDAHATKFIYYDGSANGPDPECRSGGGYSGLICRTMPAAQPAPGQPELLVTKYRSYNQLGEPTEVTESPGGKEVTESTRKTITSYDAAGRTDTSRQIGGGKELPPTKIVYSTATGMPVEQKFICETSCEGFDSQASVIAYDKLGRPEQYTDADANTSKTTYDIDGRPATIFDGKGTQTFGYDATSGLLTKLEDSAAGTFTAAYDADGSLTERGLPNGLVAKTTYSEVGAPVKLSYTKTGCSEKCIWLEESNERSIYGQILSQKSLASSQQYSYDKAGRLTLTKDTPTGGGCTTRAYGYEGEAGKDSNRTSLTTRVSVGSCVESGGTPQTYSYDAADRLTDSGIVYDSFGRITSLPAKDAGGSILSTTFFGNEMIASQSQAGLTNSYQLDANRRVRQVVQSGSKEGTEVLHYAMSSDSTAWTERGSVWTRNIGGIGGELAAIQPSTGETSLQLANLHGDVIATASLSSTAKEPTAKFEFDEFGNPKQGSAGRFGWLGGKQRRTELPSGIIQMGVRSYIPSIGRFISTDPVQGGSSNAYDYADADPVNGLDLAGTCSKKKWRSCKPLMSVKKTRAGKRESRGHFVPGIPGNPFKNAHAITSKVGPCTFSGYGQEYGAGHYNVFASLGFNCEESATIAAHFIIPGTGIGPPSSAKAGGDGEYGGMGLHIGWTGPAHPPMGLCILVLWGDEGSKESCGPVIWI